MRRGSVEERKFSYRVRLLDGAYVRRDAVWIVSCVVAIRLWFAASGVAMDSWAARCRSADRVRCFDLLGGNWDVQRVSGFGWISLSSVIVGF